MVAFLFSGQGSQKVGMGLDLPRGPYERASRILGYDLLRVCTLGPEDQLNRTDVSQPAILVTSLAALDLYQSRVSVPPSAAAGLSLGEYTALVAAHAILFDDAVRLVQLRGQAMQAACDAVPSGMASVLELDRGKVSAACSQAGAQIANFNAPGQIVISGPKTNLETAIELCKAAGARRVIPLKVAGAYHSEVMRPAQQKLEAALAAIRIERPKFPVYSNVSARPYKEPDEIRRLLAQQIVSPVKWSETIENIGADRYIEFGPGRVLVGLVRKIQPDAAAVALEAAADLEAACA